MRTLLAALVAVALTSCGGGGGDSTATPSPTPTPQPTPPAAEPTPSVFFSDASAGLPASRAAGCFDAHATDIDADGDLDLLLAGFAQVGASNLVYINDGAGTFTDISATALPANRRVSEHVASGDFDADGDIDAVFANVNSNSGSQHEYYLNTGTGGTFAQSGAALPVAGLTSFAAAHDFDNDSDLDIFLANFGTSHLLINDGTGAFADDSVARLPGTDPEITEDSGIGDINGDGFIDIVLAYRGSRFDGQGLQNQVWINDGLGSFTDTTATAMPALTNSTFDVELVDVDGDTDLDAIVGNATIGGTNAPLLDNLLINDGSGRFADQTATRWPQATLANTYGVSTMDIDRDGDMDILLADNRGASGTGSARAYANDGNGNFTEQTAQLLGQVVGNIVDIEVADFNGDGLLDLYFCATSNFGSATSARDFLLFGQ